QAGEAILANWCVDNASRAKAFKQTVADFVGTLVFSDFFAHQKNIRITLHFFRKRLVERLTICDFSHYLSSTVAVSASDLSDFCRRPVRRRTSVGICIIIKRIEWRLGTLLGEFYGRQHCLFRPFVEQVEL